MICLDESDITLVLTKIHKGDCNNHIDGKALVYKLLRAGYYWPILMKDIIVFVKKYNQFHRHDDLHHAPTQFLQTMTSA